MCPCGEGIQDVKHLLLSCSHTLQLTDDACLSLCDIVNQPEALLLDLVGLGKEALFTRLLNLPYLDGGERLEWMNKVGSVFYTLLRDIEKVIEPQSRVIATQPPVAT